MSIEPDKTASAKVSPIGRAASSAAMSDQVMQTSA